MFSKFFGSSQIQKIEHTTNYGKIEQNTYNIHGNHPKDEKNSSIKSPMSVFSFSLPAQNSRFVNRQAYVDAINTVFLKEKKKLFVLYGLGGSGKTQLANDYLLNAKINNKYEAVIKLRAEKTTTLCLDIVTLGKEINKNFNGKYKKDFPIKLPEDNIQDAAAVVIKWIDDHFEGRVLFLYDNVSSEDEINPFLPKSEKCYVIVTSRNGTKWPPLHSQEISSMDLESEAIPLVKKIVKRDLHPEITELKLLIAKYLYCYPLAIAQAACYIEQKKISVNGYIKKYEESKNSKRALLDFKNLPTELKHIYGGDEKKEEHSPVLTTFDLNFKELKDKNCIDFLIIAAYCYADGIPDWFLIELNDEIDFGAIKEELTNYSLMSFDPLSETSSIHRILQIVVHLQLDDNRLLMKLSHWLSQNYYYDYNNNFKIYNAFITHAASIVQHINNEEKINDPHELAKINYAIGIFYLDGQYDTLTSKIYLEKAISEINHTESHAYDFLKSKIYRQYAKCLFKSKSDPKICNQYFSKAMKCNPSIEHTILIDKIEMQYLAIVNNRELKLKEKIISLNKLAFSCLRLVGKIKKEKYSEELAIVACQNKYKRIAFPLTQLCNKMIGFLLKDIHELKDSQTDKKKAKNKELKRYRKINRNHLKKIDTIPPPDTEWLPDRLTASQLYSNAKSYNALKKFDAALTEMNTIFNKDNLFNTFGDNRKADLVCFYIDILLIGCNKNKAEIINIIIKIKIKIKIKDKVGLLKIDNKINSITESSELIRKKKKRKKPTKEALKPENNDSSLQQKKKKNASISSPLQKLSLLRKPSSGLNDRKKTPTQPVPGGLKRKRS